MIANESGVADVADPLGGSYVVEAWTDEIVQRARDYIRRIDEMGGALAALEGGFQQREIAEAAYRYQMAVEEKREVVVGVNAYQAEEELPTAVLRIDPAAERDQVDRLRALRERRDAGRAASSLRDLTAGAREDRNLMPQILGCVRAEVTLGEISDALRQVYGEYREAGLD